MLFLDCILSYTKFALFFSNLFRGSMPPNSVKNITTNLKKKKNECLSGRLISPQIYLHNNIYNRHRTYIDGHESKPANSNFSNFFLFDKFEGNTFLHNVLKNLVPSMSLYPSFRQLSKPAISHNDTFQQNKTG